LENGHFEQYVKQALAIISLQLVTLKHDSKQNKQLLCDLQRSFSEMATTIQEALQDLAAKVSENTDVVNEEVQTSADATADILAGIQALKDAQGDPAATQAAIDAIEAAAGTVGQSTQNIKNAQAPLQAAADALKGQLTPASGGTTGGTTGGTDTGSGGTSDGTLGGTTSAPAPTPEV